LLRLLLQDVLPSNQFILRPPVPAQVQGWDKKASGDESSSAAKDTSSGVAPAAACLGGLGPGISWLLSAKSRGPRGFPNTEGSSSTSGL
jgi:hypothetical protein